LFDAVDTFFQQCDTHTHTIDEGEWSPSRPGRFTPRERAPVIHWIGGWVCLRSGLDMVVNRKIPSFCQDSNHWSRLELFVSECTARH